MKYKTTINCSQEDIFKAIAGEFLDDWLKEKGQDLDYPDLKAGMWYSKRSIKNPKGVNKNIAVIKLLEYNYPTAYQYTYKSDTYFKVFGLWTQEIDSENCEVIIQEFEQRLDGEHGILFNPDKEEEIKKIPLSRKIMLNNTVKAIKKRNLAKQEQV